MSVNYYCKTIERRTLWEEVVLKSCFSHEKTQVKKTGKNLIMARISVNGLKPVQVSLKLSVTPKLWDQRTHRAIGRSSEAVELNAMLDGVQARFINIHNDLVKRGEDISPEILKNLFLGKNATPTLLEYFKERLTEKEKLVEAGRLKKVTKDKFDRTIRYIMAFMHSDLQIRDIRFNQITLDFIEKFNVYLLSTQGLTYNSAAKHLEHLQWTVNKAFQNGMMPRNPFNDFRIKKTETKKEYLNKYELGKILSKKFASERIEKLRDVFIFCCFTGLSYSDAQKATVDNLSRENDGRLWLITYRNKTEVKSTVLLLDIAIKILDKYAEHRKKTGRLLPVISNQKCNEYLKEIADVCGIKKHLKFHCSRHTWTMIAAELEIPKETIAATLGHGGNEVTDIYIRFDQKKVDRAIR